MSRNRSLLNARNKQIKELYAKYAAEFVLGPKGQKVEKYRHEAMLVMVAKKFYLEPATVGNILCLPDDESDERQMDLFQTG